MVGIGVGRLIAADDRLRREASMIARLSILMVIFSLPPLCSIAFWTILTMTRCGRRHHPRWPDGRHLSQRQFVSLRTGERRRVGGDDPAEFHQIDARDIPADDIQTPQVEQLFGKRGNMRRIGEKPAADSALRYRLDARLRDGREIIRSGDRWRGRRGAARWRRNRASASALRQSQCAGAGRP